MNITDNSVVQYHYTLKDEAGEVLQSSKDIEPLVYLHGHNNIIVGLEKAMLGKSKGDSFSVTVPPEEAFGNRQDHSTQRVPIKYLRGAKKWKAGMVAVIETKQGMRQVQVMKAGKFMADVDLNHPLAGKTLIFEVEILDVRAASQDEIAHGHAHGTGGHQH
jgi:FKBP-type peptidyl-prolyl cis-trans isomerase SlyD